MRIERECSRSEYRGETGPVLGIPVERTRICFGMNELGFGNLCSVVTGELSVEVTVRDSHGKLVLNGMLNAVNLDDEDGSVLLELRDVVPVLVRRMS
jgi:hypothetical protein